MSAGISGYTIININKSKTNEMMISRTDFLYYKLSLDLILPFMKERLENSYLRHNIRAKLENIINEYKKINPYDPAERI